MLRSVNWIEWVILNDIDADLDNNNTFDYLRYYIAWMR